MVVWDSLTGETISVVNREEYFARAVKVPSPTNNPQEPDDVTVAHNKRDFVNRPRLSKTIRTNFSSLCQKSGNANRSLRNRNDAFDFEKFLETFSVDDDCASEASGPCLLYTSDAADE